MGGPPLVFCVQDERWNSLTPPPGVGFDQNQCQGPLKAGRSVGQGATGASLVPDFFVARETDRVRVLGQQRPQDLVLPDLPFLRILRRRARRTGRSPQRLPRLAAVEDPDRGVGAAPGAFQAAQEMMLAEARQVEETAPLGVAEGALE